MNLATKIGMGAAALAPAAAITTAGMLAYRHADAKADAARAEDLRQWQPWFDEFLTEFPTIQEPSPWSDKPNAHEFMERQTHQPPPWVTVDHTGGSALRINADMPVHTKLYRDAMDPIMFGGMALGAAITFVGAVANRPALMAGGIAAAGAGLLAGGVGASSGTSNEAGLQVSDARFGRARSDRNSN